MKTKLALTVLLLLPGCGDSTTEQRQQQKQRLAELAKSGANPSQFVRAEHFGVFPLKPGADLDEMNEIVDAMHPWLKKTGGVYHVDKQGDIWKMDFEHEKDTDEILVHLEEVTNLTHLNFGYSQIADAGLAHLEGLKNLEGLTFEGTQVTDEGLVHLEGLTSLQRLDLSDTSITDTGLVLLEGSQTWTVSTSTARRSPTRV